MMSKGPAWHGLSVCSKVVPFWDGVSSHLAAPLQRGFFCRLLIVGVRAVTRAGSCLSTLGAIGDRCEVCSTAAELISLFPA
jgi:hypothetical protein